MFYKSSLVHVLQIQSSPYFTNPIVLQIQFSPIVLQIQSLFYKSSSCFTKWIKSNLQYACWHGIFTNLDRTAADRNPVHL